jgi:predicted O-methyltransferase YrrM
MDRNHDRIKGFSGKRWPQLQSEFRPFLKLLQREGVRRYLEIGCLHGDTFHAVGMALPEDSTLVAVDLPATKRGVEGAGRHKDSADWLRAAAADLHKHGRNAHVIIGNSHDAQTIALAAAHAPYDAVFIDGDHTIEGATADWENYGPMGRIVAFHDISGEKFRADVRKVWRQAREGLRWEEFVSDDVRGGIGVLWRE